MLPSLLDRHGVWKIRYVGHGSSNDSPKVPPRSAAHAAAGAVGSIEASDDGDGGKDRHGDDDDAHVVMHLIRVR